MDQRLWSESDGMVVDRCDEAFTTVEPYRGVNANMHTVEAFLAASDVTGDPLWRARALRITERVLDFARDSSWRIPEHYDEGWHPQPGYNDDKPRDRFRPYGATVGHAMEWARLALNLRAALGDEAPDWLLPSARSLFDAPSRTAGRSTAGPASSTPRTGTARRSCATGCTGWRPRPRPPPPCSTPSPASSRTPRGTRPGGTTSTSTSATATAGRGGTSSTATNRPSSTVWSGKPDTYHALQATLVPRLPAAPSFATALAGGRLDH